MHAAGAKIGCVQARATGALVKHHQLFTLFKAPKRRGQCAHIHRLRCHVEQVVQNAPDLGIEHPDQGRASGHLHPCQLFDRQAPGVFLVHRGNIVEAVEIRQVLQVGAAFHKFFSAAMQKPDMGITALDDFAVQLEHEAQHAVRGRVLGPEIDVEVTDLLLTRLGVVELGSVHHDAVSSAQPGAYSAL